MDVKFQVDAKKLSLKNILMISLISIICVCVYAIILKNIGVVSVIVDSISTVVSLIATILMALRYREQWFMWITTYDLLMLLMSICCFISSIIGFINWTKSANKTKSSI